MSFNAATGSTDCIRFQKKNSAPKLALSLAGQLLSFASSHCLIGEDKLPLHSAGRGFVLFCVGAQHSHLRDPHQTVQSNCEANTRVCHQSINTDSLVARACHCDSFVAVETIFVCCGGLFVQSCTCSGRLAALQVSLQTVSPGSGSACC